MLAYKHRAYLPESKGGDAHSLTYRHSDALGSVIPVKTGIQSKYPIHGSRLPSG